MKYINNITQTKLISLVVLFLVLFSNYSFYENVLKVYPWNLLNFGFLISIT